MSLDRIAPLPPEEGGTLEHLRRIGSQLRGAARDLPRVARLVWRSSPSLTAGLAVLTVLASLWPLGVAYAGKRVIDAVVARSRADGMRWVLIELALMTALTLSIRAIDVAKQLLGARLAIDVHMLILEKALSLELRHFEDADFYDKLTRARREAGSRPLQVVTEGFRIAQNGLTLIGYVVMLIGFSGWAVLGLLAAAIPATLVEMRFSQQAFRLRNWRAPETRKLNYLEYVLANDRHAKEVKLLGLGPLLLERYRTLSETFYAEDRRLALRRNAWAFLLQLISLGAFYACYVALALLALAGRLTLGNLTLYMIAFRQGQYAFQAMLTGIGTLYENSLYISNLFEYLDLDVRAPLEKEKQVGLGHGHGHGHEEEKRIDHDHGHDRGGEKGLRLEGVGFRYPGQERWVLRGLDLFVPAGQSLALVGRNGAGKSTLIKLVTGLYRPTEGRILLDGRDIRDWEPETLRERFGVVLQDYSQYQLTFAENVGLGSPPDLGDEARILRATERGGADEVLGQLASGLETQLGSWFKDGVELSGGQWQKIALSRGFMREQADILVLDEPTAALDAEAEHAVFERFRRLTAGRTAILISHRFPTVRMADRIAVLEDGRLVELGTHAELLAKQGTYARLFALQARGYS